MSANVASGLEMPDSTEGKTRKRASNPKVKSSFASSTIARVLIAIPWIGFTVFVIAFGSWVFAITIACFAILALHEFYSLVREYRPLVLAGLAGSVALVLTASSYGPKQLLMIIAATFLFTFILTMGRRDRTYVTVSLGVTLLGVVWIGLALSHAVLLRELAHGGGLLIGVVASTFIGDTAAYFAGKLYGKRHLAARISPNKTWEGLFAGTLGSIGTFWFVGLYQDWITGWESVAMGIGVAAVAPLGDLFESMIKRDFDIKDSGGFFGVHGGVLDRIDALLFTVVVGYYLAGAILLA